MPVDLLVACGTMFALMVAPPFLLAFVLFLLPGRKGRLRTERSVAHAGLSADEARALYAARLAHEGFVVVRDADVLRAVRRPAAGAGTGAHADKVVHVELRFAPAANAVHIHAVATIGDFIFHDSGEGRMIDLTLDRLLSADRGSEPPPLVPNASFMAMSSATGAALCFAVLALSVWMFAGSAPTAGRAALVAAPVLAAVGTMGMSWQARRVIRSRPAEFRGEALVHLTLAIGVAVLVIGGVVLYHRYGAVIAHAFTGRIY